MALTLTGTLLSIDEGITCGVVQSGIGYMGTVKGNVYPVTISTKVIGDALLSLDEKITGIATDGTTVFVGTNKGNIYGITINGGAVSAVLAHIDKYIVGMLVATYLYVALDDGTVKYYTIS
jgi:hypothetical protein